MEWQAVIKERQFNNVSMLDLIIHLSFNNGRQIAL
jgi:hypothetical protein